MTITMTYSLRKFALTVHLTSSVGWIGAVVAYPALDITAVTSQDVQLVRAAYLAMELTALYVIVPLAFAALLTGLVMSVSTKWGLFRHYWVVITLVLTIFSTVVLLLETQTISYLAELAASGVDPRELPGTLPHSGGGLLMLLVITVLNVYKPRGMTQYGWRKQQQHRKESSAVDAGLT